MLVKCGLPGKHDITSCLSPGLPAAVIPAQQRSLPTASVPTYLHRVCSASLSYLYPYLPA